MVRKSLIAKMVTVGVLVVGFAQADVILNPTVLNAYNQKWQEIESVSFVDFSGDGIIKAGEDVTFKITMDKNWWGTHDYDVLKLWIDGEVVNAPAGSNSTLLTKTAYDYIWDYNKGVKNYTDDKYSHKNWKGGTKDFFYTAAFDAGIYDLTASVMCSESLSGLNSRGKSDVPTIADFKKWKENTNRYQGSTNGYTFDVVANNVPEPATFSLIGIGLVSLLAIRRKKS